MAGIANSLYDIKTLDDMARRVSSIHKLHPLIKLLTAVVYLIAVVSFDKYEISRLLPFVFYPILIFALAELPAAPILKRLLLIEPIIIGIGILNPVFDNHKLIIGGIIISRGWITFLSIFIKSGLTVTVSMLLIATTGMEKLAAALRLLKVPRIFVLQLLLTYRYIAILIEEVARMLRAYSLRAPGQKGIRMNAWGSFAGQLILRTFDRAQRVYEAMSLRGFAGEYNTGAAAKINLRDCAYFAGWSLFFLIARFINIPVLIGTLITEVIR